MKLRDVLKGVLSEEELRYVPSTFEIVGSRDKAIAIVEIPEELEAKKRLIAEAIMKIHKSVRTVLGKASERKTPYRVREYELLAGEPDTEVVHKEYGIRLKLDPTKVYFSPREGAERLRIARQVRPGEFVMVMFAGVGPYALMIAKVQPEVERIVAIEINPAAYEYMVENVRMNGLEGKVVPVLGDVRERAREWYGACDRVVMPLPKGAYKYLDEAFQCLRREGGVIHFYYWAREDSLYEDALELLGGYAWKHGRRVRVLGKRKVSAYAPRVWKVCIDAEVR